jgi:hypothetical protein
VAHADLMPFAVRDGFSECHSVVHTLQCRAGLRKEDLADFSETYCLCAALEKRDSSFLFPGHGFGGSAEAAKHGVALLLYSRFVPQQPLRNNADAGVPS